MRSKTRLPWLTSSWPGAGSAPWKQRSSRSAPKCVASSCGSATLSICRRRRSVFITVAPASVKKSCVKSKSVWSAAIAVFVRLLRVIVSHYTVHEAGSPTVACRKGYFELGVRG